MTSHLVFFAGDVRNHHVVCGRADVLQLFASEDVQTNQMDFSVSVLSGLGSRHVNNLAWLVLDHHVAVLPESRALDGHAVSSPRGSGIEIMLICHAAGVSGDSIWERRVRT